MSKRTCSVAGCPKPVHSRGWCQTHYSRWFQTGNIQADTPVRATGTTGCTEPGCGTEKHYAKGLCANHYQQQWERDHPEVMELRELRQSARKAGQDPNFIEAHFRSHHGRCDTCGRTPPETGRKRIRRLTIDHNHRTGAFRGLLCASCNSAIGFAGDDPDRLRILADYLEQGGGGDIDKQLAV